MKLRRPLLLSSAGMVTGLALAGTALAGPTAPRVTVRVEGATRTLLPPTTVSAPAHGSITRDRTPAGTCPADSAAGALNAATRGHWGGTYDQGIGLFVTRILSTALRNDKVAYWAFYVDGRSASTGICDTKLHRGESLLFAAVPAKGSTPLPIVVRAPRTVKAGRRFAVRTFVYTGRGSATRPVTRVSFRQSERVTRSAHGGGEGTSTTRRNGVTMMSNSVPGVITLVASAKGYIRSAPTTIRIVR